MTLINATFDVPKFKFTGVRIKEAEVAPYLKGLNLVPNPHFLKELTQALNVAVGVEVEIENAKRAVMSPGWLMKDDGSLRNGGVEFITKVGCRAYQAFQMVEELLQDCKDAGHQWSDRTSIHVHVNVQNLNLDQVQSFMLLYIIVEEALFKFASPERRSNIFCVPFVDQGPQGSNMLWVIKNAHKYSAMNLAAIQLFGSIEFRHMAGTFAAEHVNRWILLLTLLKRAAAHIPLEQVKAKISKLKKESDYATFLREVFAGYNWLLPWTAHEIDLAVSEAKMYFFDEGGID